MTLSLAFALCFGFTVLLHWLRGQSWSSASRFELDTSMFPSSSTGDVQKVLSSSITSPLFLVA